MGRDYFAVLGLEPGAEEGEVKRAYRSLAKQWHPDKNKAPHAEEKFKEVAAAYEFLLSADRREKLTRDIQREREAASKPKPKPPPPPSPSPSPSSFPNKASSKPSKEQTREEKKKAHWTSSFRDKGKAKAKAAKSSSSRSRSEEEDNWAEEESEWEKMFSGTPHSSSSNTSPFNSSKMPFSSAFNSFFQEVGSMFEDGFEFSTFYDDFKDPFAIPRSKRRGKGGKRGKAPPPHNPDNVAPESGTTEGLNEEYLFSKPPRPSPFSPPGGGMLQCQFCQKPMSSMEAKEDHERGCSARVFSFDSDSDEDNQGAWQWGDNWDDLGWQGGTEAPRDWRQAHEDLLNRVRRDRRQAKQRERENFLPMDGKVTCNVCRQPVAVRDFAEHRSQCGRNFRCYGSQTSSNQPGPSKFARAREYARGVPRPAGDSQHAPDSQSPQPPPRPAPASTRNDGGQGTQAGRQPSGRSQGGATSQGQGQGKGAQTKAQASHARLWQSGHAPAPDLGLQGSGFSPRSRPQAGDGCRSCRHRYGVNARAHCSCGVRVSAGV